jgi:hypothetical protein
MISRSVMVALVFTAAALAGCGKTGELDQPAPMWGEKAKAEYAAKKKAEAQQRAEEDAARKATPTSSVVDDPTNQPLTQAPYAPPLPSSTSNPRAGGPQGALGNPGSGPNN